MGWWWACKRQRHDSPKDYIYLAGGIIAVDVEGGQEVEPRMRKPGGVKRIEVAVEVEFDSLSRN